MKTFLNRVASIRTENDLKDAHIEISRAYSSYKISHEQWSELRKALQAKRTEKGFAWGKGI